MKIWENATLTVGTHYSDFYTLHDYYSAHGVNGKFTGSTDGATLELEYELANLPNSQYLVNQGDIFEATTSNPTSTPFLKTLSLRPSGYIRFKAVVANDSITGFTLDFIQTGRG